LSTGVSQRDVIFTRRPILELEQWGDPGGLFESAVIDCMDLLPARHFPIFDPEHTQPAPFDVSPAQVYPFDDTVFPECRFVLHYFMTSHGTPATSGAEPHMELTCMTSAGGIFPDTTTSPFLRVGFAGPSASIGSLAGGINVPGEGQSGSALIPGRYLKCVARFNSVDPGSFKLGVYVAPIGG
jgi:hypothetical protein